jgi:hypothetical protein
MINTKGKVAMIVIVDELCYRHAVVLCENSVLANRTKYNFFTSDEVNDFSAIRAFGVVNSHGGSPLDVEDNCFEKNDDQHHDFSYPEPFSHHYLLSVKLCASYHHGDKMCTVHFTQNHTLVVMLLSHCQSPLHDLVSTR